MQPGKACEPWPATAGRQVARYPKVNRLCISTAGSPSHCLACCGHWAAPRTSLASRAQWLSAVAPALLLNLQSARETWHALTARLQQPAAPECHREHVSQVQAHIASPDETAMKFSKCITCAGMPGQTQEMLSRLLSNGHHVCRACRQETYRNGHLAQALLRGFLGWIAVGGWSCCTCKHHHYHFTAGCSGSTE